MTPFFFALLFAAEEVEYLGDLTAAGWTVMLLSVGAVLALLTYCLTKVLSLPPVEAEHLHDPLDIDTRDTEDAD